MVKMHQGTAALLIVVSLLVAVVSLSPDATSLSSQNKPIERVAIIGAGIAGLSLAHSLTNSPTLATGFQGSMGVSIYDSRDSLNYKLGAGMQLNGGLAVLGKINPAVQQAVRDTGIGVSKIRGRHKAWFQEDATDRMWDIDVKEAVRKVGGRAEDELIEDGELVWCSVTRGALQVRTVTG
jgi:hypothetical protein